jgi:hypothetical protein
MTQKTYRTAQGKIVDLGALQLKNEHIRAIGNMNVNSRGDLVDANNQPIDTRNQQVDRQYQKQVSNVQSAPVHSSKRASTIAANADKVKVAPVPLEDFEDNFIEPATAPTSGLAAAMSRANDK